MTIWSVKYPPGFGVRQSSGAFASQCVRVEKAPEDWRTPGRCRVSSVLLRNRIAFILLFSLLSIPMLQAQNFPEVSELPIRAKLPDPLVLQNGQRIKTEKD